MTAPTIDRADADRRARAALARPPKPASPARVAFRLDALSTAVDAVEDMTAWGPCLTAADVDRLRAIAARVITITTDAAQVTP